MKMKPLISILLITILIAISACSFLRLPQFGKLPAGERLERVKHSPNYKDGRFQNIVPTPFLTNASFLKVIGEIAGRTGKRIEPIDEIPTIETNLKGINPNENIFVWFGHSSYLLQVNGDRFLVDPVLSGHASPVPFFGKAFRGTNLYTPDDIPHINYLLITHDHYDHLNYETVSALRNRIDTVICPLGVGEDFEYWGFDKNKIIEKDWNESIPLANKCTLHTVTARHFSGRGFTRNQTLWTSYVLETPDFRIYMDCDGGYGGHFSDISRQFGPFDLAFIENGQYNELWQYVHKTPEEAVKAALDLLARQVMPIHSAKFAESSHAWDDPLIRFTKLSDSLHLRTLTPEIGELVHFTDTTQIFSKWWEGVKYEC